MFFSKILGAKPILINRVIQSFFLALICAVLLVISFENYLLFHALTEIFSVVIAGGIFIVAWNSRRFLGNNYLLFLGLAYLFVGGIDLLHTIAYQDMGVLPENDINLAPQLWIVARYTESLSLLAAPFFLNRTLRPARVFFFYLVLSSIVLALIFTGRFPVCFIDGQGLTPFKKICEYLISGILVLAMFFLVKRRDRMEGDIFMMLVAAIFFSIAAELFFTFYVSMFGLSNLAGHFFKIISFYLIYKAIIETGLRKPYALLLRDLKLSEERYRNIYSIAPLAFILWDEDFRITDWNKSAEEIFGWSETEARDRNFFELLVPEDSRSQVENNVKGILPGSVKSNSLENLTREGRRIFCEWNISGRYDNDGKLIGAIALGLDITERRSTEEALSREANINAVIARLSRAILSNDSIKDLSVLMLEAAQSLTGSRFGFVGYMDPATGYLVTPTLTMDIWEGCQVPGKDIVFKKFQGLWGWVLENKQALMTNSPAEDARSQGIPDGHVAIERFLSVPAMVGEKLVGQIALANPVRPYEEYDLELVKRLADIYAIAIQRMQAEQAIRGSERELRQYKEHLEKLVEERTEEIRQAHDALQKEYFERREVEEEVVKQKSLLESIFISTPDAMIITDIDHKIIMSNPGTTRTFGYKSEEIIGQKNAQLYENSEEFERQGEARFNISAGDALNPYTVNYRRKNGQVFPGETVSAVIRGADGKTVGHLGLIRDVTDRKRIDSELRQAHKMEAIGTLAGGIAHDFNNILGVIIGYAEMIELFNARQDDSLQPRVDEILTAASRAQDLVQQILTFSRKAEQERKSLLLTPVVKETIKFLRASLPSTIEIKQQIEAEHAKVLADPTQMHQLLMNLCTNAGHAMREGGVLGVQLTETTFGPEIVEQQPNLHPGTYVKLVVSDTGHGIPEENLLRIFDPYFTTKSPGEGTGMGLALVQGIVRNHGGVVTVASTPGEGTVFEVLLPCTEKTEEHTEPRQRMPLSGGYERILFVDDEKQLVKNAKEILGNLGYEVAAFDKSIEALDVFRADPEGFDLIITDQTMPLMTGDELIKEIMAIRPSMPVVLCTGHSVEMTAEKAREMGCRDFVMKPLGARNLARVVRKALAV